MRAELSLLLAIALCFGACARDRTPAPEEQWSDIELALVQQGHSSTAQAPVRPRVPFEVVYEGDSEIFDSAAGTLKRYIPDEPARTIRIQLTEAERDTLWELLSNSGFFHAPVNVGHGSLGMSGVYGPIRISVTTDSSEHAVTWSPTLPELVPEMRGLHPRALDPQEPGLYALDKQLGRMLQQRASYRALPRTLNY